MPRSAPLFNFSPGPSPLAVPLPAAGALSTEPRLVGSVLVGWVLVPSFEAAPVAGGPWSGFVGPGEEALAPGFPGSMLSGVVTVGGVGAVCANANTEAHRVKQAADKNNFLRIAHPPRRRDRCFNLDHQSCPGPHLIKISL